MRNFVLDPSLTRLGLLGRCKRTATATTPTWRKGLAGLVGLLLAFTAMPALAEMSGSTVDKIADIITIVVLFVVPILGVTVFLMVHVLPEKFAERRHHPQRDAITTLCFLSLLFGGLLWPLAWLWAFTKPVGYRAAYGTDKHDDYYEKMAAKHLGGELMEDEVTHLREDLEAMESKGPLPPKLKRLKQALAKRPPQTTTEASAAQPPPSLPAAANGGTA